MAHRVTCDCCDRELDNLESIHHLECGHDVCGRCEAIGCEVCGKLWMEKEVYVMRFGHPQLVKGGGVPPVQPGEIGPDPVTDPPPPPLPPPPPSPIVDFGGPDVETGIREFLYGGVNLETWIQRIVQKELESQKESESDLEDEVGRVAREIWQWFALNGWLRLIGGVEPKVASGSLNPPPDLYKLVKRLLSPV